MPGNTLVIGEALVPKSTFSEEEGGKKAIGDEYKELFDLITTILVSVYEEVLTAETYCWRCHPLLPRYS